MAQQHVATAWCITDAKSRNRILVEATVFEVGACSFAFQCTFELLHEKRLCYAMHFHKRCALLIFFSLRGRALFGPRNGDSTLLSDDSHRFRELALLHIHHEVVDVASLAAAEAVKNLLDGGNRERWGLFLMERAESAEVLPRFLETNVFADNPNNVSLLFYSLRN